jgi:quinol-cytochrome oxidoreductase complex cytochrome b subunit
MNNIFSKIKESFKAALSGQETTNNLIRWWGVIAYLVAFFIFDGVIKMLNIYAVTVVLSVIAIIYFAWHIYVLKKCSPKNPKLTKEEKQKIKEEKRKDLGKKIMRKLFLQESITKWDPIFVTIVIDAFCIAQFLSYITK